MTDRYEKIREALAMEPTPGPWGFTELPRDMQRDGYRFSISRGGLGWWIAKVTHEANGGSGAANAALISACDPDTIRALLEERDELAARLAAAQQPVKDGCHCGTCTCNPNMTPAVRFDLSPAQTEGAIREHLIRLGWTPPDEHAVSQPAEALGEGEP